MFRCIFAALIYAFVILTSLAHLSNETSLKILMPSSSSDNSRQSATARDDSEEHNNTFRSASSRNLELKATVVLVDRQETVAHRYDIQKTLGRGSTGTVLLASRDEMGGKAPSSLVALKRVNISRIPEGQYYSTMWSLLAESSTIKMAQPHPNIIRCSTPMCDVSNHDAYLELEYCSRGDLFGLIVDPHGFKNAIEPKCLFRDLVRGLSHIHSLGIAHRDLKPENLLVNETGTLKIGDFGFSTIVSEAERRIGKEIPFSSNAFLTKFGTLPYASPQLVEYYDKSKQLRQAFKVMYDPFAADVWATGIIFYRLRIDSHLPWEKAAKDDVMYRFYAGNRQIILNLWESFPENISQNEMHLLSRMLEIDAKKRITAKEILNHGAFVEYDHTCK